MLADILGSLAQEQRACFILLDGKEQTLFFLRCVLFKIFFEIYNQALTIILALKALVAMENSERKASRCQW